MFIIWQIVYKCSKIRGIVTLSRSWHPAEFTLGAQHTVFGETNRKTQSHVKCTKPADIFLLSKTYVLCACVHCENCPKRRYHDGNHTNKHWSIGFLKQYSVKKCLEETVYITYAISLGDPSHILMSINSTKHVWNCHCSSYQQTGRRALNLDLK